MNNGSALDFSQQRAGVPVTPGESPLDLSVTHRKVGEAPPKKQAKWAEARGSWNGRFPTPDMTSKALEKMSELSRVGQNHSDSKSTTPSSTSRGKMQLKYKIIL